VLSSETDDFAELAPYIRRDDDNTNTHLHDRSHIEVRTTICAAYETLFIGMKGPGVVAAYTSSASKLGLTDLGKISHTTSSSPSFNYGGGVAASVLAGVFGASCLALIAYIVFSKSASAAAGGATPPQASTGDKGTYTPAPVVESTALPPVPDAGAVELAAPSPSASAV